MKENPIIKKFILLFAVLLIFGAGGFLTYKFNAKMNNIGLQIGSIAQQLAAIREDSYGNTIFYDTNFDSPQSTEIKVTTNVKNKEYRIHQLPLQTANQGMSYVIELPSGELVVIDGGFKGDGEYLHEFIMSHGGVVHSWFITHPHVDHVGAFLYNMTKPDHNGLIVKNVYYAPFTADYFAKGETGKDLEKLNEYLLFDEFEDFRTSEQAKDITFIPLNTGDTLEIEDINIECMNGFDEKIYHVNSNSLVLHMDIKGYKMMFTGDITDGSLLQMFKNYPETSPFWNVNALQIPHHGFGGLSDKLLKLTKPDFAFIDCTLPQYYDRDEAGILGAGNFGTQEMAGMLKEAGIPSMKSFFGPNVVVID